MMKTLISKLNFTFNVAQKREMNVVMSNTFGFGGHNACVLVKKIRLVIFHMRIIKKNIFKIPFSRRRDFF